MQKLQKLFLTLFKWSTSIPEDKLKIKVENGIVTLMGEVGWNYQRIAAAKAIENLEGVSGVNNYITVEATVNPIEVEKKNQRSALQKCNN